jgi:diguanylate cyclase (GGDEF)-like protein
LQVHLLFNLPLSNEGCLARLSLKLRLILGIIFMMLPLLVVILVSFVAFNDLLSTLEEVTQEVIQETAPVADLKDFLELAERHLHNGLRHPEHFDSHAYNDLVPIIDQAFAGTHELPFDHIAELAGVNKSRDLWNSARDRWQLLQTESLSETDRQQAESEMAANIREAISSLERLRTISLSEVEDGREEERRWRYTLNLFLPLVLVAGIGIAFTQASSLIKAIIEPVQSLKRGAEQLAAGELSYRVNEQSQDELGDLAHSFNLMAQELELSHKTLESLSTLDYLTGLANVREFYRLFHDEIRRAERYRHFFSLIILDIDTFKEVNDSYGHQVGDLVLQEVGSRVRELVRNIDHVARIGGDEFAVLLPETGSAHAAELAERIRLFFAEHQIVTAQQPEITLRVTISLGLATYPTAAALANDLFAAADQALYRAKNEGRNRLCLGEKIADVDSSETDPAGT